jgi:microcystin-dependent protein
MSAFSFTNGEPFYAYFMNAFQQFVGSLCTNFQLTLAGPTTIQVVAGTGSAQVTLGINGLFRYITSTINVAVTGAANTYNVYATTGPYSVDGSGDDSTNYAFALVVSNTAPTTNPAGPVSAYRLVGQVVWSGSTITGLTTFDGNQQVMSPYHTGQIITSIATSVPGFQPCLGGVLATATYPALSAMCGTKYNTGGEGTGNFRLPNFAGRFLLGSGTGTATGASAWTLAQTPVGANVVGGEQYHTLTANESGLVSHNHTTPQTNIATVSTANTGSTASNVISYDQGGGTLWSQSGDGSVSATLYQGGSGADYPSLIYTVGDGFSIGLQAAAHTHVIPVLTSTVPTMVSAATGGSSAATGHSMMPPLSVVNFFIKT